MVANGATRNQILRVALEQFASSGYAGTSVQDIVDAADVTKPALYYHFQSKAGLYQSLINRAHDERLRLMQEVTPPSCFVSMKRYARLVMEKGSAAPEELSELFPPVLNA